MKSILAFVQLCFFSVAPHVGAWIEIIISHRSCTTGWVAPHVGAWIEMPVPPMAHHLVKVAPHVGAWIEIK